MFQERDFIQERMVWFIPSTDGTSQIQSSFEYPDFMKQQRIQVWDEWWIEMNRIYGMIEIGSFLDNSDL